MIKGDVSNYSPPIVEIDVEELSDTLMTTSSKRAELESLTLSEMTLISTNMNSEEAESSTEEEANQANVVAKPKETKVEKVATSKETAIPVKETKSEEAPQHSTSNQSRAS